MSGSRQKVFVLGGSDEVSRILKGLTDLPMSFRSYLSALGALEGLSSGKSMLEKCQYGCCV